MTAAGPEPASVTASRQLAADSRDRRPGVPARVPPVVRRTRGTTAGRPAIRPLGRPVPEHPDETGPADDPAAAEWRVGRAPPAGDGAP